MSLSKVTLDGVEFTTIQTRNSCAAGKTPCFFDAPNIDSCLTVRFALCSGKTPETQVIFLDDAGLLRHLTARITG